MNARPIYAIHMNIEAIAASTPYLLVDLSNTTGFPHNGTQEVHVLGFQMSTEQANDGSFDIYIGVITEIDSSDGTAKFFYALHEQNVLNPTDSADKGIAAVDFTHGGSNPAGLNAEVLGGATRWFVSNNSLAASAVWQDDVAIVTPIGTAAPGVGDIVMYVEEVSDGGTIDIGLTLFYETA